MMQSLNFLNAAEEGLLPARAGEHMRRGGGRWHAAHEQAAAPKRGVEARRQSCARGAA